MFCIEPKQQECEAKRAQKEARKGKLNEYCEAKYYKNPIWKRKEIFDTVFHNTKLILKRGKCVFFSLCFEAEITYCKLKQN
jgi:hypothetical protein